MKTNSTSLVSVSRMPALLCRCAFALLILLCMAGRVVGQGTVPELLSFQGYMEDGNGAPLGSNAPANYEVVFRIFSTATGGATRWTEKQTVTFDKGNYSVLLGQGTDVPPEQRPILSSVMSGAPGNEIYVETTVKINGNDAKILPRLRLLPTPYAFLAKQVVNVDGSVINSGTIAAARIPTLDGSKITGVLSVAQIPNLDGSKITGVLGSAQIPLLDGSKISGNLDGSKITGNLDASKITGTIADGQLSGNIPRLNGGNNFVNALTASGGFSAVGASGSFATPFFGPANGMMVGLQLTATGANGPQFRFSRGSDGYFYDIGQNGSGGFTIEANNDVARLTIDASGNVGIGTTTPTEAKLVVRGVTGPRPQAPGNIAAFSTTGAGGTQGDTLYTIPFNTIYAPDGYVVGGAFIAVSDERIKVIKGRSDSASDLQILRGIEITDYRFKDAVGKGNAPQKKVIAQQVEKVFPQAISRQTDVVPDIYQTAPIKDGWISLTTDLKKGERVRLIAAKGDATVHEVLEVAKDKFRTAFKPEGDNVFVYGREVNDFRTVDYEAIAMLNVSATQELERRLVKLEKRDSHLTELERKASQVDAAEKENATLRTKLDQQEKRLVALESLMRAKLDSVQQASLRTTATPEGN